MVDETRRPEMPRVADEVATELDAFGEAEPTERSDAYLVVRIGATSRLLTIRPAQELTFGRGSQADVVIDEPKASRVHAACRIDNGRLVLEDLGSRNGTRVGDRVLSGDKIALARGDQFSIGRVEVVVVAAAGDEAERLPKHTDEQGDPGPDVIARAPASAEVFQLAKKLSRAPTTVLLLGETGVGKEVVAAYIHQASPRADKPYVRINCGSISESLLESELFGHEKGAFTGAEKRKIGLFESAHGGTLFLDEIGEMSLSTQVKFLRVLETRTVTRVGGVAEVAVDVRVVAATHRDLTQAVANGSFREDLYYRVSTSTVRVPPLRDRKEDIEPLAELFATNLARRMNQSVPQIEADARAALLAHHFPGNVRELRNAVEHAVVMAEGGDVNARHLPEAFADLARGRPPSPQSAPSGAAIKDQLAEVERVTILRALEETSGNRTHAAALLGMSRRTLVYKLARYGINKKE